MSNEPNEIEREPDEFAGAERNWRRLLREPGALPGQGLADRDAAWDKLFERLGERPRRRFFGYRIAAACFLISLIPVSRLFQARPLSGKDRVPTQHVQPLVARPLTPRASTGTRQPSPAPPVLAGKQPVQTPARPAKNPGQGPLARTAVVPAMPSSAVLPDPPAAVSTTAPLVASIPPPAYPQKPAPKKIWKVVDINELEPDPARPHGMVADRKPIRLRLGLGPGNTRAAENPPPAREDDSRLKINLTTQNR